MRDFEANNAEQAFNLFSQEAIRAEIVRRAIEGEGLDSVEPSPAIPASLGGVVPISENVLADIKETVREYETAMKTLAGHYGTAMSFEKQAGPAGQLQGGGQAPNNWQPSYR